MGTSEGAGTELRGAGGRGQDMRHRKKKKRMNSLEAAANRGRQGDSGAAWQKRSCAWKNAAETDFLDPGLSA